jgi:hypothetical protein
MVEPADLNIKLQTYSWISQTLGKSAETNRLFRKKVTAGTTLFDLFTKLSALHPDFRDKVYNPATGVMNEQILVIVNNRLVQARNFRQTELHDQDTITLSIVLAGG